MVIALHTEFLSESSALGSYLLVNGVFRVAVPIFYIISGFYFYPVVLKNLQSAWIKRLLILYLIWMCIYSYFWFYIPALNADEIIGLILSFLIGYWHLWYVSGLLGAAVVLLVLKGAGPILLGAAATVAFLTGVAIQYAGNYHIFWGTVYDGIFNYNPSHRNAIFFSFPFFCIGYLINKYSIQRKVSLDFALLGVFIGMALLVLESYLNFIQPMRVGEFDNFVSLILVCPAIFIVTAKYSMEGRGDAFASYSAALYFVHVMAIQLIILFFDYSGSFLTFLVVVISLCFAIVLVAADKKMKVLL